LKTYLPDKILPFSPQPILVFFAPKPVLFMSIQVAADLAAVAAKEQAEAVAAGTAAEQAEAAAAKERAEAVEATSTAQAAEEAAAKERAEAVEAEAAVAQAAAVAAKEAAEAVEAEELAVAAEAVAAKEKAEAVEAERSAVAAAGVAAEAGKEADAKAAWAAGAAAKLASLKTCTLAVNDQGFGMDLGEMTLKVKGVVAGGQAEKAGVQVGWVVVQLGSTPVHDLSQFVAAKEAAPADDTITFKTSDVGGGATSSGQSSVAAVEESARPPLGEGGFSIGNFQVVTKDFESMRDSVFNVGPADDDQV
jgi:hypothetical protein